MFDRLITSLVALSLAFLVWLYMRSRDQEMLDNVAVPVQIVLAAGQGEAYELEMTGPSQVPVSFTGPPSRIRELRALLQRGELHVETILTVPDDRLGESYYLDTVRVEASDIHPPAGVTPFIIEGRNRIPVTLHRLVERRLPVRFEHTGEARIAQVTLEPASALVRGPQHVLDQVRVIPTQPYVTAPQAEPLAAPQIMTVSALPLVQELGGKRIQVRPSTVTARITFSAQQKVYELTDVPVQFLCPPSFPLRPVFSDERAGRITVRLQGPAGEEPPTVVAFVDLGGRKWEPGLYEEPLRLQLPREFQLAQDPPRLVTFRLDPVDATTRPGGVVRSP
jgi:hypothetical protein